MYEVIWMDYSEVVSERILEYCKQKNITVNKLASLSGINQSTVDNIIKKKTKIPNLRTIHRLSQGIGVTVSEFLDFQKMNETIFDEE